MEVTLRIKRYNPEADVKPAFKEYVVDVVGAFGKVDASITLQDGWNLTALGVARDTRIPETLGAITGSIKDLGALRASLDLGAGLWRLNFSDQGFVSGATEVPLSSPPKAAASKGSKEMWRRRGRRSSRR